MDAPFPSTAEWRQTDLPCRQRRQVCDEQLQRAIQQQEANGNKNVSLYSGVFTPLTNDGKNAFDTSLFATYSYMLPMAWNMSNRSGF